MAANHMQVFKNNNEPAGGGGDGSDAHH